MKHTMKDFFEANERAIKHIEAAARIIDNSELLKDYCFCNCKTVDDENDYKQYVMRYLEDALFDCCNYKKWYFSYLEEELTDDEIEDLQKELYKLTGNDYSYTTFKEAKGIIIEDAVLEGLI